MHSGYLKPFRGALPLALDIVSLSMKETIGFSKLTVDPLKLNMGDDYHLEGLNFTP